MEGRKIRGGCANERDRLTWPPDTKQRHQAGPSETDDHREPVDPSSLRAGRRQQVHKTLRVQDLSRDSEALRRLVEQGPSAQAVSGVY